MKNILKLQLICFLTLLSGQHLLAQQFNFARVEEGREQFVYANFGVDFGMVGIRGRSGVVACILDI